MRLTREECEKALETIRDYACICCVYGDERFGNIKANNEEFNDCYKIMQQLIKEHFDNPPLKFEELEEGMWIFDKSLQVYYRIYLYENKLFYESYNDGFFDKLELYEFDFEENRFYRKEIVDKR